MNITYHRGDDIDELVTHFKIVSYDLNDREQVKVFYHLLPKDLAATFANKFDTINNLEAAATWLRLQINGF